MGFPQKILFVCYANERRSITAEFVFKQMLVERGYTFSKDPKGTELYVDSAGVNVNPQDYNVKQMTKELGDSANKIFTFSRNIEATLAAIHQQNPAKIINLEISDRWQCGHPELMGIIKEKLTPYVFEWYLPLNNG